MEFVVRSLKWDSGEFEVGHASGTLCSLDCHIRLGHSIWKLDWHFALAHRIATCLGGLSLVSPCAYVSSLRVKRASGRETETEKEKERTRQRKKDRRRERQKDRLRKRESKKKREKERRSEGEKARNSVMKARNSVITHIAT